MPETTMDHQGDLIREPYLEDERLTRRSFTAKAAITAVGACYAAAFGYPIYRYLAAPAEDAAALAAITEVALPRADVPPPGSALRFKFGTRPAMLIHHADGSMVCFDAVCSHLGCTVQYQPEQSRIFCACHGGVYDPQTGGNVAGPPPKPLTPFNVEVKDEQIIITRV
jgi:cytochrome b6-f complex iron-sulfur subunit